MERIEHTLAPSPQLPTVCVVRRQDRIAAYGGLSVLLLGGPEALAGAASRVGSVIRDCRSFDYLDETEIADAEALGIAALRSDRGAGAFVDERVWLFGEDAFDPFLNGMSPTESTYLASDRDALRRTLEGTYALTGYRVPECGSFSPCCGHMGVELDFMRYCLERSEAGEEQFAEVARTFFGDHLREWGVLFAVVLRDKAHHPAMRYLSYALDKFIASESVTFRHSPPSLCVQRAMLD